MEQCSVEIVEILMYHEVKFEAVFILIFSSLLKTLYGKNLEYLTEF